MTPPAQCCCASGIVVALVASNDSQSACDDSSRLKRTPLIERWSLFIKPQKHTYTENENKSPGFPTVKKYHFVTVLRILSQLSHKRRIVEARVIKGRNGAKAREQSTGSRVQGARTFCARQRQKRRNQRCFYLCHSATDWDFVNRIAIMGF